MAQKNKFFVLFCFNAAFLQPKLWKENQQHNGSENWVEHKNTEHIQNPHIPLQRAIALENLTIKLSDAHSSVNS